MDKLTENEFTELLKRLTESGSAAQLLDTSLFFAHCSGSTLGAAIEKLMQHRQDVDDMIVVIKTLGELTKKVERLTTRLRGRAEA